MHIGLFGGRAGIYARVTAQRLRGFSPGENGSSIYEMASINFLRQLFICLNGILRQFVLIRINSRLAFCCISVTSAPWKTSRKVQCTWFSQDHTPKPANVTITSVIWLDLSFRAKSASGQQNAPKEGKLNMLLLW